MRVAQLPSPENEGNWTETIGGFNGGAPLRPKIVSISCSFLQNLAKSYVGAPLPIGLAPPPTGNPGSAPGDGDLLQREQMQEMSCRIYLSKVVSGDPYCGTNLTSHRWQARMADPSN